MNYNSYNSDNATGTIEVGILGSTGSIGTQTLDIVSEYPARFRASLLTAGKNWRLLAEQARKYLPRRVVIADETAYPYLRDALSDLPVEVAAGAEAIAEAAAMPELDTVVTAMVGYSGLIPTVRAIRGGKRIALANKETLVVADNNTSARRIRLGDCPGRQRALRHLPVSARRILPPGKQDSSHSQRRTFPHQKPRGTRTCHRGRRSEPSQLGHGSESHHRLRIDDEQRIRNDRGEMAVRLPSRQDRDCSPSPEHCPFDGGIQ